MIDIFKELACTFEFLIKTFDFELIHKEKNSKFIGEYLIIYFNKNSGIQLEFSANENWFHCVIRRLVNGELAKYSDNLNSIGFEDLALLESDNNYDHFDYVVASKGFKTVLKNTANLLKRNCLKFTSGTWIDGKRIKQLRDQEQFKKFGLKATVPKELTFFEKIKESAKNILTTNGFTLLFDSEEQPPYSINSHPQTVLYKKAHITIKIEQGDWRDFYYLYYVSINDKKCFRIDLSSNNDVNYQIKKMNNNLIELINQLNF